MALALFKRPTSKGGRLIVCQAWSPSQFRFNITGRQILNSANLNPPANSDLAGYPGDVSPPVFVALAAGTSASSGVRGLDLHMLHHIIIVERHLDDRVEKQLIGRGRRIGQMGRLQVGQ